MHKIASGGVYLTYKLYLGSKIIGNVSVVNSGLYCCVQCNYPQECGERAWLIAVCEEGNKNLGFCGVLPDGYGIYRYISIKSFPGKIKCFRIDTKEKVISDFPVFVDKPFMYIDRLSTATLYIKNGTKLIRL